MIKELKRALYNRRQRKTADATLGALARALAILRGIRRSGTGQLPLRESCDVAIQQGAAFKKWCTEDKPIRRVQVWVEGQPVMTVTPVEDSVTVKAFTFDVSSPSEAVMQVLKAEEGEEPVVLLNLPLASVSTSGIDQTTELPNAQRLRLKVLMTDAGRFQTLVSFAEKDHARPMNAVSPVKARRRIRRSWSQFNNVWGSNPAVLWKPRLNPLVLASSFMIVATSFALFYVSTLQMRHPKSPQVLLANNDDKGIDISATKSSHAQPVSISSSRKKPVLNRNVRVPMATTVTLLPYEEERGRIGEEPSIASVPKPGKSICLALKLPDESKAGPHMIQLVDPYDATLYQKQAQSSDGKTLKITVSSRLFSRGKNKLKVSHGDQTIAYYYFAIDR
jgi:hypothetical protein